MDDARSRGDDLDEVWDAVRSADPRGMVSSEITDVLGCVRRLRSWLDAAEVRAVRRLGELAEVGASEPVESAIASGTAVSGRDAAAASARSTLCDSLPGAEEALAAGRATSSHVDALASAANRLDEEVRSEFLAHGDELLTRAEHLTVEQFRRTCDRLAAQLRARDDGTVDDEVRRQRAASRVSRWIDRVTGMHHTHLELDPERDARLHSLVHAEIARARATDRSGDLTWRQLEVEGFLRATTGWADGSTETGACRCSPVDRPHAVDRVPEVTIVMTLDALTAAARGAGRCETENGIPVPIETARRWCCDAEVIPVVLGGDGVAVDHGRSRRTASREQRRRLRAMHVGCAFPGCAVGFDACRLHHVRFWGRDHGSTDIDNLLPLCERHHHLVHEGGWSLTMTPDRTATWHRPDGALHRRATTLSRFTDPSAPP